MSRDERIKRMQQRQTQEQKFQRKLAYVIPNDIPRYKVKEGENRIDIIPYKITNPKNPAVTINQLEIGDLDYFQQLEVHNNVGVNNNSYLCAKRMFGEPCFICEAQIDLYDQNERETAKKLYPQQRVAYNVIDLDEPEKGIQVWEVSYYWVEHELRNLAAAKSKRGPAIIFGDYEIGKTIIFYGTENKPFGLKPSNFAFEDRKPYDVSICDKAYPLDQYYVMPDYEVIQKDYLQIDDGQTEEGQKETKEPENVARMDSEELEDKFKTSAEADKAFLEANTDIRDETPAETTSTRRRRREPEPEVELNACPYGHEFGKDFDTHNDCTKCPDDTYDKCGDKFDSLNLV